jgi:hypothetical protein
LATEDSAKPRQVILPSDEWQVHGHGRKKYMKTEYVWQVVATAGISILMGGCLSGPRVGNDAGVPERHPVQVAVHAARPVVVDGKLDDAVWQLAPAYPFCVPAAASAALAAPVESGEVRYAWDDTYFYVAARFTDSDIVAEGKEDGLAQFQFGDLLELFLKPVNDTYYWELYATPLNRQTCYWFPGRGRLGLPSGFAGKAPGMVVAAQKQGTVNDWRDHDVAWTVEMAIPRAVLTAYGATFGPGEPWRVLAARYNYSRWLPRQGPELSACVPLDQANYHLLEQYATLVLAP